MLPRSFVFDVFDFIRVSFCFHCRASRSPVTPSLAMSPCASRNIYQPNRIKNRLGEHSSGLPKWPRHFVFLQRIEKTALFVNRQSRSKPRKPLPRDSHPTPDSKTEATPQGVQYQILAGISPPEPRGWEFPAPSASRGRRKIFRARARPAPENAPCAHETSGLYSSMQTRGRTPGSIRRNRRFEREKQGEEGMTEYEQANLIIGVMGLIPAYGGMLLIWHGIRVMSKNAEMRAADRNASTSK